VFAPMPSASDSTAVAVTSGVARSARNASRSSGMGLPARMLTRERQDLASGRVRNSIDHDGATPHETKRPDSYQDGNYYSDPEKGLFTFRDLLHICLPLSAGLGRGP
jgi:hypothetical protein